jgi:hypothetical protein
MIKIKGVIAVGVILLFMGMALSPVSAQTTIKERLEVSMTGNLAPVQISENDLTVMEKFMPALLEKMKTATSYSSLIETVRSCMTEYGRQPVLVFILKLLIKAIDFNFKFNQLRPIRKTAFVMSWGFTNKFLALGKNKVNMVRSITGWYYSGKSNVILNSRTIILDPHPFSIKTLTGRQIGLMANFIGLYIHRSGNIGDKAITFFFGYANTIRGLDLSPIHN